MEQIKPPRVTIQRTFPRMPKAPAQAPRPPAPAPPPARGPQKIELLRVARVATMLDVSRKRIYQMIEEGKLPAVRLGPRQLRISRHCVEELVARSAEDPFM